MINVKTFRILGAALLTGLVLFACETPDSPNFTTQHKVKTPLLIDKKLPFIGNENAIIDTTSDDFDSLFTIENSGLVSLSREEDIDFGSFDDAIPAIDAQPRTVNSQIGEINGEEADPSSAAVGNFQPEFDGSGSASFEEIVGSPPPNSGAPVPAGSNTIRISLDAGNFNSATITDGGIRLEFTNNLGFNINTLTAQLYSNTQGAESASGSQVTGNNISDGETFSDLITFNDGEQIETDFEIEVFLSWNNQNFQGDGAASLDVSATDENLTVSRANSDIAAQALTPTTPDIQLSDPTFQFAEMTDNNVGLELNRLNITVTNNTELPLTNRDQTGLPTILLRNSNGNVIDSEQELLVEGQPGAGSIQQNESGSVTFNLSGERMTRTMSYELNLGTAGGSGLVVTSDDEVLIEASTSDLEVETARVKLDQEEFESADQIELDDEDFVFEQSGHHVTLDGGELVIDSLVNNLDVAMERLSIEIDGIFPDPNNTNDPLNIVFAGSSDGPEGSYQYRQIGANERNMDREAIRIDLTGFKIAAINNVMDYNVLARTEDTGTRAVDVSSSDEVNAKIQIQNLEVREAIGVIKEKELLLNDDMPENGNDVLDLFNDDEAVIQDFEDLEELSERIGETNFFETKFDLLYDINMGVPARLYAIIAGINSEGETVYLKPTQNGPYAVDDPAKIQGLWVDGSQADPENVLMLPINAANNIGEIFNGAISFDQNSSNVDEFLSNFPTEIRFIGKALANPGEGEGFVTTPIEFNSNVGFEIPIQLQNNSDSEVLKDTLDSDLSDLPDPQKDDSKLTEAKLKISYENMLPLQVDLNLKFLDKDTLLVTEVPLPSEEPLRIGAPTIGAASFANQPAQGQVVISLNEEQSEVLNQTRFIRLGGTFITSEGKRVKIRYDDYIQVSIQGEFSIETNVSN